MDVSEYTVALPSNKRAAIVGPGGGVRKKKIDRKFLFKIIQAQQIRLNLFSELVTGLSEQHAEMRKQMTFWHERCNELTAQLHQPVEAQHVVS